jgi:sulfate transport system substrate-binding protein
VILRGGTEADATDLVTRIYKQVPVLDSGARGATTTFLQKKIGDVHIAWENEAPLEVREAKGQLDIVYPPISILAEPQVAVVDVTVRRKGTKKAAEAYLQFLYTDQGQEIIAKHFYRPSNPEILAKHRATFPDIRLFSITEIGKSWDEVRARLVADGSVFDKIYKP